MYNRPKPRTKDKTQALLRVVRTESGIYPTPRQYSFRAILPPPSESRFSIPSLDDHLLLSFSTPSLIATPSRASRPNSGLAGSASSSVEAASLLFLAP